MPRFLFFKFFFCGIQNGWLLLVSMPMQGAAKITEIGNRKRYQGCCGTFFTNKITNDFLLLGSRKIFSECCICMSWKTSITWIRCRTFPLRQRQKRSFCASHLAKGYKNKFVTFLPQIPPRLFLRRRLPPLYTSVNLGNCGVRGKIPQGKDVRYCAWQFSMQNKPLKGRGGEDRGVIGLSEVALECFSRRRCRCGKFIAEELWGVRKIKMEINQFLRKN